MKVAKKLILSQLSDIYDENEIRSISRLIFERVLGLSGLQAHLNQDQTISAANLAHINEILRRLRRFEPIQYILNETEFYGLKLKVNPSVLIPRPETEELVEWIVRECDKLAPAILDIGTGSGCIPIALVKNLPGASADAWDISNEALMVAKENARINQVVVSFYQVDILNFNFPVHPKKYDIIVSNPPYVTVSDKVSMQKNVVDYEPSIALFVPETDPLIFFRAIAELSLSLLSPGGKVFF